MEFNKLKAIIDLNRLQDYDFAYQFIQAKLAGDFEPSRE